MKYGNKADIALITVLLLFIPAVILKILYNGFFIPDMLFFTIEAALIGSIADWFAVTALFRKPLGFSWHTALIPKNRDRLTDSIALMVEQELLNRENILDKLDKVEITPVIASLVDNSAPETVSSAICNYLNNKLPKLDISLISEYLEGFIKDGLKRLKLPGMIPEFIRDTEKSDRYTQLAETIISGLSAYIRSEKARTSIYRLLKKSTLSSLSASPFAAKAFLSLLKGGGNLNLYTLSEMIQNELAVMLDEMHDPQNPFTLMISCQLTSVVAEQASDVTVLNGIEEWKNILIGRIDLKEEIEKAVRSVIHSETLMKALAGQISKELETYLRRPVKNLPEDDLENIFKNAAASLVKSEYNLLGRTVRDTLNSFTDNRLVRFIEEKVGDDLQWIRINGTIVGGTVGMLVFMFLRLFYEPVVVTLVWQYFSR